MITDTERARRFISEQEWIFAKTMADIPHFYCLKMYCGDPAEFLWFAQYLLQHSEPGFFYCTAYQYFHLDGWKYWIMDSTPESCDLINRARFG
ncbi:MAG: hypothetical protein J6Y63_00730 [Bacteroidales bacterium]|nr:hypothetical protein [Bacteroidales bacterium]